MPEYGRIRLIIERVDDDDSHAHGRDSKFGAVLVDVMLHGERPGMKVFDLRELGLSPEHQIEKDYEARLYASYRLLPRPDPTGTLQSIDPTSLQAIADRISTRFFPPHSTWLEAAKAAANAGQLAIVLDVDPLLGDLPWELVKLPGLTLRPIVIRSVGTPLWKHHRQAQSAQAPEDPVLISLMCEEVDGFDGLADIVAEERENLTTAFKQLIRIEHFSDYQSFALALRNQNLLNRAIGLHFLGHGHVDDQGPYLACPQSRSSRRLQKLRPDTLLPLLARRTTPLSWIFLGACYAGSDAVSLRAYPSGGFAASLVKHGVSNGALAMRFEVTPQFALDFSRHFYNDLTQAQRPDVEAAYDTARAALLPTAEFEAELSAVSLFVNDAAEKMQIRWPAKNDPAADARAASTATGFHGHLAPHANRPDAGAVIADVQKLTTTRRWDRTEADRLSSALAELRANAGNPAQATELKTWLDRMRMVHVPAGSYELGYTPDQIERVCSGLVGKFSPAVVEQTREMMQAFKPRTVITRGFLVDRFLVTIADFARFVEATRHVTSAERRRSQITWKTFPEERDPEFPVVTVSYRDAEAYARWAGKRLLHEEEWQILVRNGDGRIYPWGFDYSESYCNTGENGDMANLSRVTHFEDGVSEHGCYDLLGNAEDWTQTRTEDGQNYRICGGSWRMTCEIYGIPGFHRQGRTDTFTDDLGFRCAIGDAPER
jgi:formylglycine-generating enzyme required for sulfatase activity